MQYLNSVDVQYHNLLETVLTQPVRGDRTGTGTHSLFGAQLHFEDISTKFPLITTKKVFWRGVVEELLWMLRGETNIKPLVDKGINIWNDWPLKYYNSCVSNNLEISMKEFVEKIKIDEDFAKNWGELGPVYGYQWRNRPYYKKCDDRKNTDQLGNAIKDLRNNPESRRIIVDSWNVAEIEEMVQSGLPPCHMMFQFYTRRMTIEERCKYCENPRITNNWTEEEWHNWLDGNDVPKRYLDCQVYIRSNDLLLGAPFNIAQYALLTTLVAKVVNMVPGTLVYTIGDAHIYLNHVEQVKEQLQRSSTDVSPVLIIDEFKEDPADYLYEDLKLSNYNPHATIKADIAV